MAEKVRRKDPKAVSNRKNLPCRNQTEGESLFERYYL